MKALLLVIAMAAVAHAGPVVDVTLADKDLEGAFAPLVVQYDEPIGLAVIANNPKLGLLKGDLVRAINGEAALVSPSRRLRSDSDLMYLDVVRGGKVVVVRLVITRSVVEEHVDRDRYKEHLDMLQRWGGDAFKQVTKNGNPSGVSVDLFFSPLLQGDIVRKIDGVAVTTPADALAALQGAADHAEIALEIERLGRTLSVKIILDTPVTVDLTKIKKINDTTYEISRDLVDSVLANPMGIAKGARVVPAVKDGKPAGFKLYAIRPSSIFAALGFENGDTIVKINGMDMTSADKALEVYTKLRDAKKLTVIIERQGKTVTLTYTIK
jgi:membrane-associated protease RseP (regulator of RpoE activity)